MKKITLTTEELNTLKRTANLHGLTIPYDENGEINQGFLFGAKIGGLLGTYFSETGDEKGLQKVLDTIHETVGGEKKFSVREIDATGTKH